MTLTPAECARLFTAALSDENLDLDPEQTRVAHDDHGITLTDDQVEALDYLVCGALDADQTTTTWSTEDIPLRLTPGEAAVILIGLRELAILR